jgi:type I restriction enzyme S subunit
MLHTDSFVGAVSARCSGSNYPAINPSDLSLILVSLPQEPEQQKIADCLTSLDELIALETQKLDALKAHKRGLMQQLFPREGETTPRLRFPEFRNAGPWEVKRLGEVCEINPSCGPLPDRFIYVDLESVVDGRLMQRREISRASAPSRAQRVIERGDILFQTVRPYQRNNMFFDRNDGNYVASTGYAQLRFSQNARFLYQMLHTDSFVGAVLARCSGSNYPAINPSDLSLILVSLPQEPEQQKIADCLSSLDELITLETQKLEALKAHKKGLMQQLFPQEVKP